VALAPSGGRAGGALLTMILRGSMLQHYSKPHVIEKKSPLAASNASR